VRAEELTPQRGARFPLDGADHDLTRVEVVEEVHEELVRIWRKLAHLYGDHRRCPADNLGAREKGANLRAHGLVPVAGVVHDVGENRRIKARRDVVQVAG
jgi:hypothetical protein